MIRCTNCGAYLDSISEICDCERQGDLATQNEKAPCVRAHAKGQRTNDMDQDTTTEDEIQAAWQEWEAI